jgi:hypothetical protein
VPEVSELCSPPIMTLEDKAGSVVLLDLFQHRKSRTRAAGMGSAHAGGVCDRPVGRLQLAEVMDLP